MSKGRFRFDLVQYHRTEGYVIAPHGLPRPTVHGLNAATVPSMDLDLVVRNISSPRNPAIVCLSRLAGPGGRFPQETSNTSVKVSGILDILQYDPMPHRKKSKPMKRVTLAADPDDYAVINELAHRNDFSASWIIRVSMRDFLERYQGETELEIPLHQGAR